MSLLADLERDEGFRANPYKDTADIYTIGIGRNLEACPLTGAEWRSLLEHGEIAVSVSKEGAQRLLSTGVAQAALQCQSTFTWWLSLNEPRREVLVNMCFNIGVTRLAGFRNMLAAIKVGDFEVAAEELLDSRYAIQVGARAQRLATMLRTGMRP